MKDGVVTLKKGSFAMKDGVMTCNGFELVDSARLEKLFHPEKAGGTPRTQRKYAAEAKKLFSKSFFGSQLRFYGITFPRSATEAQLSSLLDKAVLAKQVRAPVLFPPCAPPRTGPHVTYTQGLS